jgi:hypothetical protein
MTVQLKLNIHHIPGCFSLVDTDGIVYRANSPIRNRFYDPGNEDEKERAYLDMIEFGLGVSEGWTLARNALGSVWYNDKVQEIPLVPKKS